MMCPMTHIDQHPRSQEGSFVPGTSNNPCAPRYSTALGLLNTQHIGPSTHGVVPASDFGTQSTNSTTPTAVAANGDVAGRAEVDLADGDGLVDQRGLRAGIGGGELKLDPAKIGIMGFSAGAELAAPAALFFDDFDRNNSNAADPLAKVSARPDFVGVIYPGPTPFTRDPATKIPRNVPPSFIASAGSGDKVHALWATDYFTAMLKAGVPNLEMHIYGNGGHGGGLTARGGIPFGTWTNRYVDWFNDLGFLEKPGKPTKAAADVEAFAKKSAR
jgi:hypothetical protein